MPEAAPVYGPACGPFRARVPMPDEIARKLFYKLNEVCQITDTQPYVLRFWESEFPQLASEKNRSGQRVYRRADIDLVFRIKRLLYQEEYTIAGARKAIDDDRETIVDPPPTKSRSHRAPAEEAPVVTVKAPEPTSLFGESRPESPEPPQPPAVSEEEARYRALYEEALVSLTNLKGELARSEEQLSQARERTRRVASRLEASLEP
jgi:DNA-binding transcriptional MerR regulator